MLRSLPGPVFFPLRALAIVYADFFRGVPTILVIAMLGFGAPALGLSCVPTSVMFWGIVALVLIYTAYVSEVYRAGIESVHPSQEAAARSLGLSRCADAAARDPAAGGAPRHPAAAQRLHRPAEGHRARRHAGRGRGVPAVADRHERDLQLHRLSGAAVLFVAITIPLARFTDWLIRATAAAPAGGRRVTETLAVESSPSRSADTRCCAASTSTVAEHEVVR